MQHGQAHVLCWDEQQGFGGPSVCVELYFSLLHLLHFEYEQTAYRWCSVPLFLESTSDIFIHSTELESLKDAIGRICSVLHAEL